MKIERGDYLHLEAWMALDLGLKGNELLVYGLIHGFSRAKEQRFFGSIEYLMEWTNASKKTVYNSLNSLLEKGLIIKDEEEYHEHKFTYYRVNLALANHYAAGGEEEKEEADPPVKQERAKKKNEKKVEDLENLFSDFAEKFSFTEKTREDLISTLNDFVEARKQSNNKMNDLAITRLLNKLAKLAGSDGDKAIELLDESILNGWKSVFEHDNFKKPRKQPERRPAPSPAEGADLIAKLAEYGYKWNDEHGEPDLKTIKHLIESDDLTREYYCSCGDLIKI